MIWKSHVQRIPSGNDLITPWMRTQAGSMYDTVIDRVEDLCSGLVADIMKCQEILVLPHRQPAVWTQTAWIEQSHGDASVEQHTEMQSGEQGLYHGRDAKSTGMPPCLRETNPASDRQTFFRRWPK